MGNIIAWASESGIKLFFYQQHKPLAWIEAPPISPLNPRAEICRPILLFENETTLYIAWGSWIKLVDIQVNIY